jgi:hypothetical protein
MELVQEVPVRFAGGRGGVGPATRAQANLIQVMRTGAPMCLDGVLPVPAGTTPHRLAEALGELLLRHESLRTTFRLIGRPLQVVRSVGGTVMTVYELGDELTDHRIEEVRLTHWRHPFCDLETELPIRVAAITSAGVLTHVVVALCHVVVDAIALAIVLADLDALLAGRPLAPPGVQPMDLAGLERDPAVRRRLDASLRHWERLLADAPHTLFPRGPAPAEPYHINLLIRSPALAKAVHQAARRAGVSGSAIALTALAALVAHRCGVRRCPLLLPTSNRYLPQLHDFVGQLAADCFVVADLRGVPGFDKLAARMLRDSIRGYWHGRFDSAELWELFDRTTLGRGFYAHGREVVFSHTDTPNLERFGLLGTPVPRPAHAPDDDPLAWSRLSESMMWIEGEPHVSNLALDVFQLENEFVGMLRASPWCFSYPDVAAFGTALERLLLAVGEADVALADLEAVTGLPPIPRGSGWYQVDGGWADLLTVYQLLAGVAGEDCYVVAVPDERHGHRIVGHVPHAAPGMTPEALHRACVAALPLPAGVMTPHEYVIHWPEPVAGTGRAPR